MDTSVIGLIKKKLSTFLGEWFLSVGSGVPYIQFLTQKQKNFPAFESILINQILSVEGVRTLESLRPDIQKVPNRNYFSINIDFSITTEDLESESGSLTIAG